MSEQEGVDTSIAVNYTDVKELNGSGIDEDVASVVDLLASIKLLQGQVDETKKRILARLAATRHTTVLVDAHRVTIAKGKTMRRLDVDKLTKLGVKQAVIEASYVVTTGEPSLRISTQVAETA